MTDLSQQTEALLKALTQLHNDLMWTNISEGMAVVLLVAIFLIVAFRRI